MNLKPCLQCINIRIHVSLLYPFASHSARPCRTVEAASFGRLLQNGFRFLTYENLGLASCIPQHFVQCCNLSALFAVLSITFSHPSPPHFCAVLPSSISLFRLSPLSLSLSLSLACYLSLPSTLAPSRHLHLTPLSMSALSSSCDAVVLSPPPSPHPSSQHCVYPLPASLFFYESTLCNAIPSPLPCFPPQHLCRAVATLPPASPPQHLRSAVTSLPPSLPSALIVQCYHHPPYLCSAVPSPPALPTPALVQCCRHPLTPPSP